MEAQRNRVPDLASLYPAATAAVWTACGCLLVLLPGLWQLPWLPVGLAAVAACICWWRLTPGAARLFVAFMPLGAALAAVHMAAPWRTYLRHLPDCATHAEIRATVVSPGYAGDSISWLAEESTVTVRLNSVRVREGSWKTCSGRLLVRCPDGVGLRYGTEVTADGRLVRPDAPSFPGAFDYGRYLRCGGIVHLFVARELRVTGEARGWRRFAAVIYDLRDRCAERLTRGIAPGNHARLLAAMTLGYRQGLERDTRRRYLRSGAIHIFAISGLHVGILASLLGVTGRLLRLPYRVRNGLLPPILGLYVIMSGHAPSAVRAWIMLSVWAVSRAAMLPVLPLNVLGAAALVLLLLNPLNIGRSGFQFSFVIVATLLLGLPLIRAVLAATDERRLWLPRGRRRPSLPGYVLRLGAGVAGVSLLAWLGGLGLVAWYNGLFIPGSVGVNFGVAALAWLTLALAGVKLAAGILPLPGPLAAAGARVLSATLGGIDLLADAGAGAPACLVVGRPAVSLCIAYYAALLLLLLPGQPRRRRILAVTVLSLIAAGIAVGRAPGRESVVVFRGAGNCEPAVVVLPPGREPVTVVNTGGRGTPRVMLEWLRLHGRPALEALVLTTDRNDCAGDAAELVAAVPVRTLVVPHSVRRNGAAAEACELQKRRGGRIRQTKPREEGDRTVTFGGGRAHWTRKGRRTEVRLHCALGTSSTAVTVMTDPYSGATVTADWGGNRVTNLHVPIAMQPSVRVMLRPE